MRAVLAVFALALAAAGCAELGVVTDGTSISYGKPSRGRLIDGVRLADKGEGFTTREIWQKRGNRYGTDELVDLLTAVSRRMRHHVRDVRLVIADLSGTGGGAAHAFHRSHQSGRDVDLLYYMRDAEGKPFEPDAMRVLDPRGQARDGSGMRVDVPRTWLLVRELLTAHEAFVQYIFIYRPIAEMLIEHATKLGEPEAIIARAVKALKQPGDSAPHNDHMHVRVYCAPTDRQFGCVDIGPLDLLAEREAERAQLTETVAAALPRSDAPVASAADVWAATVTSSVTSTMPAASFSSLFRGARADRIDLRSWR